MTYLNKKERLDKLESIDVGLGFVAFMQKHTRFKGWPMGMLIENNDAISSYEHYKNKLVTEKAAKATTDKGEVVVVRRQEETRPIMPEWGDAFRAAPNCILRSALFGAVREKDREKIDNKEIASNDGVKITYTGEELNQGDFDVWCGVIQLSRNKQRQFSFTSTELLKIIGIPHSNGTANHMILHKRLHRLNETTIHVLFKNKRYNASLIDSLAEDKLKTAKQKGTEDSDGTKILYAGIYEIKLNEAFLDMFASNEWSSFAWSARRQLSGKVLALWLHCFYSTHKNPFLYSVTRIHELCGSKVKPKDMRKFKYELKKAIEVVCEATGWEGGIDRADNVFIKKTKR